MSNIKNPMLGKTIYLYYVNMNDGSGSGLNSSEIIIHKKQTVVFENDHTIILNTPSLCGIAKSGENKGTVLEKHFLHLRVGDSYWGNTVEFMLYSELLLSAEELKSMIKEAIKNKTKGMVEINIDCIDDMQLETDDMIVSE